MSSSKDAPLSPRSQLALSCFEELLDCAVADVASECHRIARLGLDRSVDTEEEELCVWAERAAAAAAGDLHPGSGSGGGGEEGGGSKGGVDVFGQTHPAIAADVVECMNCGRHVVAGRFAPHLEKCMGKGRKARTKTTRSSTAARTRNCNGSTASSYSPYSIAVNSNRASVSNGVPDCGGGTGGDHSNHAP
ncbi:SAGA-associated factor 11-like isoform X1 [Phragmites australis]|uniref:SAGA-associated factor 11-like isoform X1 n=1 Tax=Phragmites australis TaxID=29695 RepID=UPI002D777611|nr:SAGA-associated factor 11-like isoform X1 [Phragmites australis]